MPTQGLTPIDNQADCVFVTCRLRENQGILTAPERTLICETIELYHERRYRLAAYVVMDDYIHVAMQLRKDFELWEIIQGWKSYTANRLYRTFGRHESIWQMGYYGRPLKSRRQIDQALLCIATSPQRQWPDMADYRWFHAFGSYLDLLPDELKPRELRGLSEPVSPITDSPFYRCENSSLGSDTWSREEALSENITG